MTEKYEDLVHKISNVLEPGLAGYAYIRNALLWLDQNPDQVPGRTITESEIDEACSMLNYDEVTGFKSALDVLGVAVVPDPEPTNAEKLAELLRQESSLTNFGAQTVARRLDEAGVKAPGGDE